MKTDENLLKTKKNSKDLAPDKLDAMLELPVDMDLPKLIDKSENFTYPQLNFLRHIFIFKVRILEIMKKQSYCKFFHEMGIDFKIASKLSFQEFFISSEYDRVNVDFHYF